MQGALLLVCRALLLADALAAHLTTGLGNTSDKYSATDEGIVISPSNNNFTAWQDSHGRINIIQVAPMSVQQRGSDISSRVSNFSRTPLWPSSLRNDEWDHKLLDKLQIQDLGKQSSFDTNNETNIIEEFEQEPKHQDYSKVDYSSEIKSTTKPNVKSSQDEPEVWTDEVWPNSYTDTVQSFTIESHKNESGYSETFEDVRSQGSLQAPEFLHDLVADNSEPMIQTLMSVPKWTAYSGERSVRAEQQQFAASLKSLMRADNKSARAGRDQDVDLVLSGERALVRLWPQFGDLLDQLLQLASDSCKSIPLVPLVSQYQGTDTPNLKMIMFTARGKRVLRAGDSMPRTADMLVVYVPGWWNTPSDSAARTLRDALVPAAGALLVLDTRAAFCRPYLAAAARVQHVADHLARWVLRCGLPPARLHLLGFSLGAHVAALAALRVRAAAGQRLGRVSALEPAAPCLNAGGWRRGANHVQVVHTSRSLALRRPLGHADVYAAVRCAPACQHAAAWRLFAASARDPAALTAPRCLRPRDLAAGNCHGHNATLGFRCAPDARGVFFLQTPYSA